MENIFAVRRGLGIKGEILIQIGDVMPFLVGDRVEQSTPRTSLWLPERETDFQRQGEEMCMRAYVCVCVSVG